MKLCGISVLAGVMLCVAAVTEVRAVKVAFDTPWSFRATFTAVDTDPAVPEPAAPNEASYRLWGELIVRTDISPGDLEELTGQVSRIWAPYGVTVVWEHRIPPAIVPPGFSGWIRVLIEARGTDHVVPRNRRESALAAVHMADGIPRNVIYVSLDVARRLVRGAPGDLRRADHSRLAARVAGRAVAHEMGHYLLGSAGHTPEGLMRRTFTVGDALDDDIGRFRLVPAEIERLAQRFEREILPEWRAAAGAQ